MSKIFRLYKDGASTYEDWNNSPSFPYNSTNRDSIDDPDGASARHEITSIPSPFARIDLIKTAFKEVCKPDKSTRKINLDGQTIFHKMVSDTLDVAEIFFNIDKFADKVQVVKWNPSEMLAELEASHSEGHKYLADALRKYLKSDAKSYNFDKLQNIYLLNYLNGPDPINIIGATSPATLFFSNANDQSYVSGIYFGQDKPFDSEYQPLYKRDFDFVKYLFTLRASIPNFATLFPEVNAYLDATYRAISDQDKKNELNGATAAGLQQFSEIAVINQQQNDRVEVLGHLIHKKGNASVSTESDFQINTQKDLPTLPLVLPVDSGNRYASLRYTTDNWGTQNKAPYADPEANIDLRTLPYDGAKRAYLTISDFLEDALIRVPHKLNSAGYFDGHMTATQSGEAFLLPVKPLLFKYFTTEEFMGTMTDGKPMFEMKHLAGGSVRVDLRIPIKGSGNIKYIEYTRLYYANSHADIAANEGCVVDMNFTGFVMPPVRFNMPEDAVYNISCVQPTNSRIDFSFYREAERINIPAKTCRNESDETLTKADNYIIQGKNFDYIRVSNHHGYHGLAIPKFKQQRSTETFEFAIDLGTSNTHIEYRQGNGAPQAFSFTKQDRQLCEMFTPQINQFGYQEDLNLESELMEKDFLPEEIGSGDFKFPTRTVLSYAKTVDWSNAIEPFTLANLPFTYDKRDNLAYNKVKYNIKWGRGDELSVMEAYVRNLMLIIRNKVLLNNGDLPRTKITWFYPISMSPNRLHQLCETWNDAYRKYFGDGVTFAMTESEAPIQYFFRRYATATSLVNVDIGGGTTDIAFAKDKVISHVTSFRFAANSIFENPYSNLDEHNGIVDFHKGDFLQLLQERNLEELTRVFNSDNNAKPANMASFLFGLKDNSQALAAGINPRTLDFNYALQDDENFKITFIVFYTSIIYHIAQITKALGLDTPRHISFSGNGSKIISVITSDPVLLAKYTKKVFEKVLDTPYGRELEILGLERDSNPKGSTCKGGLIDAAAGDCSEKTIVFRGDNSGTVSPADTYANVSDAQKGSTVGAVKDFFHFVFDVMNTEFNFNRNFGVRNEAIAVAREAAQRDLDTFLDRGIAQRLEETESGSPIEETFFFYPIKGALNTISADIYQSLRS